ncbi:hypothetical protein QL996_08720 [Planococcus sp. APC 4015]|nr:hypothetical protein [Planococcus sp. APC 4015]
MRWTAAIVATALAAVGAIVGVQSAQAASQGPGFGTWPSSAIGWEGAFVAPDGSLVYCIVPGAANPTGATSSAGYRGWIESNSPFGTAYIGGDTAAKINTLVSVWGQTWDNVEASAISFAVKHLANPGALYASGGWNGSHDLNGFINHKLVGLVGSGTVAAVQSRTQMLLGAVDGVTAGVANGSGWFEITTDPSHSALGTVTMHGTPATGTTSLTNATFDATGSAALSGMREGVAYSVRGVPPTGDATPYRIGAYGVFGSGYAPQLHIWETPYQQRTVGPGGQGSFTVSGWDEYERSAAFAPYITTQVEQKYVPGGRFVDHVTFRTSLNEWPRVGGGFAVVHATATVYSTPEQPTTTSQEIPADAVPVGTLALTTDPAIGPSQSYRVESDGELPGPGHYTAVWTIDGAAQEPSTIGYLEGGSAYHRQELFGEATQMSMVPDITSEAQKVAQKGGTAVDTVIVADVLPAGGADLSTALYRVPADTPAFGACLVDNLVWQSDVLHVDAVGRYDFTAPVVPEFGEYAWQHRAADVLGDEIMTSECGIESEMTRVPTPTIDSLAPETVGFGGVVHDVAIVDGLVPVDGETYVTFELYRAADGVDPAATCTADTLVGDTVATPVLVTAAGEYTSPGIRVLSSGIHYSIESLWWRADAVSEPVLLDRGDCGRAHERTTVSEVTLTTNATPEVAIGDGFRDEAHVTGLDAATAASIVFEVFHNPVGQVPTCGADTLVDTRRIEIVGSGTFRSPQLTATTEGAQVWVATLVHTADDGTETILAQGECGDPDEITLVLPELPLTEPELPLTEGELPRTGSALPAGALLLGGAAALFAGAAIVFGRAARRPVAA